MDNHDYRARGRGDLGKECLRSTLAEARTEVAALQAHLHAVTLTRDRMHLELQTAATIIAEDEATAHDLRAQRAALRAGRVADATAMREATAALQAAQTEIARLHTALDAPHPAPSPRYPTAIPAAERAGWEAAGRDRAAGPTTTKGA